MSTNENRESERGDGDISHATDFIHSNRNTHRKIPTTEATSSKAALRKRPTNELQCKD